MKNPLETILMYKDKGITPTGTIQLKKNGTYDVSTYASALVSVSPKFGEIGIKNNTSISVVYENRFSFGTTSLEISYIPATLSPNTSHALLAPYDDFGGKWGSTVVHLTANTPISISGQDASWADLTPNSDTDKWVVIAPQNSNQVNRPYLIITEAE